MNPKQAVRKLIVSVWLLAAAAHGQVSSTGEIRGRVLDPSDAAVPGAQLRLVDEATAIERTTTAAEDGGFVFLRLAAGTYRLTASAVGFQTAVSTGVVVETARTADLVMRMTVGSVSETVEVSGAASVLETSSSTVSTTVRNELLNTLPLNGRDLLGFALMSPGAQRGSSDRNSTFNGLPNASLNITLDGVNNNSQRFKSGGTSNFVFAPLRLGAIEEVTVSTTGVGADASGEGAMQMRFVTKRGTNEFHGSAFEQFRNDALNANSWFNNAAGLRRPTLRLNEFGGNVGGPIWRNKFFFFLNYEELRQPQQTLVENTILTTEAQQGIFRYRGTDNVERTVNLLQAAGQAGQASQVDRIMAGQLTTMNAARSLGNVVSQDLFRERIQWNRAGGPTERYPTARFDYQINKSLSATGTWNLRWRDIRPSAPWPGLAEQSRFRSTYYVASIGLNWTVTPTILNEFRIGQQHNPELFNVGEEPKQFDLGGRLATISYPALGIDPLVRAQLTIPRNNPVWNFYDNLNLVRGSHTITTGGSMLRTSNWEATYFPSGIPALALGVDNTDPVANVLRNALTASRTEDQTNALNVYALLTGRLNGISSTRRLDENDKQYRDGSPRVLRELMTTWGLYVQDSWRAKPTLTLNFGLRWEFSGAVENTNGTYTSPTVEDLYGPSKRLFAPGVLDGVQSPQIPLRARPYGRDYLNPAPNFGFAWNPAGDRGFLSRIFGNHKTVIRGSFGLSYYQEGLNAFNSYAGSNPGLNQSLSLSPNQPGFTPGSLSVSSPLPALITFPTSFAPPFPQSLFTYTGNNLSSMLPNLRTPYVTNWSFGIQRDLGARTILEVRYVGNKGTHIWHGYNINEVNIFENGFLREFNTARNNLNINAANGIANSFENRGLPGQAALPIFETAFGPRGGQAAVTAAQGFANTTFLNQLREGQAGALANGLTQSSGTYLCRMVGNGLPYCQTAGFNAPGPYPINFFHANPFNSSNNNSTLRLQTDDSYSSYNGLQMEVRRDTRGLSFRANYTFSKALGDLFAESDTAFLNYATLRDRKLDKGPSVFDIRHAALASAAYQLPFGKGKMFLSGNAIADRIVGGWTLGSLVRLQSGRPFKLSSGRLTVNQSDSGVILNGMTASELQSKLTIRSGPTRNISFVDSSLVAADGRANPSFLSAPTNPGEFGQFIYLYGPKLFSADMSLMKSIAITERVHTELLVEALNVFNHPVFGATGGQGNSVNITGTTFGQSTVTAIPPRNLQLRLVVRF